MLVEAAFRQPRGHQQTLLLHLQRSRPHIYDFRIFSVLVTAKGPCDRCSKVVPRASELRRAMSAAPPDKSKHLIWQRKQEVDLASRKMLKKDMEAAKKIVWTQGISALILTFTSVLLWLRYSQAMHRVVNVPNTITAARILVTPYLAYLVIEGEYVSAISLLAVTGVSDWLDGFIARTFHQKSIIGSFLDPFADKLLIGTLSLSMMWTGLLPFPLAALIMGRDCMLMSGTFYYRLKTKNRLSGFFDTSDSVAFQVKPSLLSKVNTTLQLSVFGLALTNVVWQLPPDPVLNLLFAVVGTTTFLSGLEYLNGYMSMTGTFKPISKSVLCKVVKRTEAVAKRTEEVLKFPLQKAVQRTKERLKQ